MLQFIPQVEGSHASGYWFSSSGIILATGSMPVPICHTHVKLIYPLKQMIFSLCIFSCLAHFRQVPAAEVLIGPVTLELDRDRALTGSLRSDYWPIIIFLLRKIDQTETAGTFLCLTLSLSVIAIIIA